MQSSYKLDQKQEITLMMLLISLYYSRTTNQVAVFLMFSALLHGYIREEKTLFKKISF